MYGLVAETIEVPEDRSWVAFARRREASETRDGGAGHPYFR